MFAALGEDAGFCQWVGLLGQQATRAAPTSRGGWAGAELVYLQAELLLGSPRQAEYRATVEAARRGGALLALELGDAGWVRRRGGARAAYELAHIHPDILFATGAAAAELGGVPLEGVASIPVIGFERGGGCSVHGTPVTAPTAQLEWPALAATFCVALFEGHAPVEAAGRAVLVAAR